MEPEEDPLLREMRVERVRRDDGRALLFYSWPQHIEAAASARAEEPPLNTWTPESGPTDV